MDMTRLQAKVAAALKDERRGLLTPELKNAVEWEKSDEAFYELLTRMRLRGWLYVKREVVLGVGAFSRYSLSDQGKKELKAAAAFFSGLFGKQENKDE